VALSIEIRPIDPKNVSLFTGGRRGLIHKFKEDKVALVALGLLLLMIATCVAAPLTAPHNPYAIDPLNILASPSARHLLGTDGEGRDVLSRLIWGGRTSLLTGVTPVAIGLFLGTLLGIVAGYYGGLVRTFTMRTMDVLLAFPAVLLSIAIAMTLGPGTRNVILALSVVLVPGVARIAESATTTACAQEYMEAARSSGANGRSIMLVQLGRNVVSAPLAYSFSTIGPVIVFAAGLNYLGLGVQPPAAEWGSMLFNMQQSLLEAPLVSVLPGIPIVIAALLFDLIGNGVRDVLDPRLV
jgi:peptide/nickel transport system permease protein